MNKKGENELILSKCKRIKAPSVAHLEQNKEILNAITKRNKHMNVQVIEFGGTKLKVNNELRNGDVLRTKCEQ